MISLPEGVEAFTLPRNRHRRFRPQSRRFRPIRSCGGNWVRRSRQPTPARRPGSRGATFSGGHRSADFQICCIAGFQTCKVSWQKRSCSRSDLNVEKRFADLAIGDTAGLETCATPRWLTARINYARV